jgi:hypothetical protein
VNFTTNAVVDRFQKDEGFPVERFWSPTHLEAISGNLALNSSFHLEESPQMGPSPFAQDKSLAVIAIHAGVELIQDGAFRSGGELERSVMDHHSILDFGDTVSTISPTAFWQI